MAFLRGVLLLAVTAIASTTATVDCNSTGSCDSDTDQAFLQVHGTKTITPAMIDEGLADLDEDAQAVEKKGQDPKWFIGDLSPCGPTANHGCSGSGTDCDTFCAKKGTKCITAGVTMPMTASALWKIDYDHLGLKCTQYIDMNNKWNQAPSIDQSGICRAPAKDATFSCGAKTSSRGVRRICPCANPTPSPTPIPTPSPTASPTPIPTPSPTPIPTPSPTASPTPSPTPKVCPTFDSVAVTTTCSCGSGGTASLCEPSQYCFKDSGTCSSNPKVCTATDSVAVTANCACGSGGTPKICTEGQYCLKDDDDDDICSFYPKATTSHPNCVQWCATHIREWKVKCGWKKNCGSCAECVGK